MKKVIESRPTSRGVFISGFVPAALIVIATFVLFNLQVFLPEGDWNGPVIGVKESVIGTTEFVKNAKGLYIESIGEIRISRDLYIDNPQDRSYIFWPGFILAGILGVRLAKFVARNGTAPVRSEESSLYGWVEVKK